jgi:hypothetical protein
MLDGDNWKYGGTPTPEDITKYYTQGYKLIVELPHCANPQEVLIVNTRLGGDLFAVSNGWGGIAWQKTDEVKVLDIIPPVPAPPVRKFTQEEADDFLNYLSAINKGPSKKRKGKKTKK